MVGARDADRFQPARRARRLERPGQPVHRHCARLAAQRQLAQRLVAEGVARQPPGKRADQHLARRRHGLKPLRDVDRIAGDRIALGAAGAEAARHHGTGVDADMQRQRLAGRGMAELGSPVDHLQRRRQRPLRVVLMRHRGAEQRQQGIADKLVDIAAMRLDALRQRFEQPVLQPPEHLGVQPFAERREAAEVGEQHGDRAPVGVGLDGTRRRRSGDGGGRRRSGCAEPGAAARAEGEAGIAGIAAAGTSARLLRPAGRAEGEAALNFEAATGAVHGRDPRDPRSPWASHRLSASDRRASPGPERPTAASSQRLRNTMQAPPDPRRRWQMASASLRVSAPMRTA